jgi:hypothetical protein
VVSKPQERCGIGQRLAVVIEENVFFSYERVKTVTNFFPQQNPPLNSQLYRQWPDV